MKCLLDANSCIHLLTGAFPELTQRVAQSDAGSIGISSVAFAEVALGTHQGKPPVQPLLDAFAANIPVLPFDEAAARVYATLPFKRGNYDRLIAAHALQLGLTVITRNTKDFADVPGLKVENWAE
jgi:tRNA(fMet)-specific endonuclease VapC